MTQLERNALLAQAKRSGLKMDPVERLDIGSPDFGVSYMDDESYSYEKVRRDVIIFEMQQAPINDRKEANLNCATDLFFSQQRRAQ